MSIDLSGIKNKVLARNLMVEIKDNHPLIQLANSLCWEELSEIVLPDLKTTTKKRCWWLGRALCLRIHLGTYLLQQIYNLTDRATEQGIKDDAAYQLFCGRYIVKKWHCPDHTKIEEFRTRLSPETQNKLSNAIANRGVELGFADASHIDIDSTVQEANMRYPTEATLLCKLATMGKKVANYLNEHILPFKIKPMEVDVKKTKSLARRYFFMKPNEKMSEKKKALSGLYEHVSKEVRLVIDNARCMGERFVEKMPWNIKKTFVAFIEKGKKYLADVKSFLETGKKVADKILSFHLKEVCCIIKNKVGKKFQFGRVVQLARTKGNFLFSGKCEQVKQSDKHSIELMLKTHQETFKDKKINSATTDKGYYSAKNEKIMAKYGVEEIGIQRPWNIKKPRAKPLPLYREVELTNRRSGIEPLIGHVKNLGQLGRSRMKSDTTMEASGFSSILGFNLRQIIRYKIAQIKLEAT